VGRSGSKQQNCVLGLFVCDPHVDVAFDIGLLRHVGVAHLWHALACLQTHALQRANCNMRWWGNTWVKCDVQIEFQEEWKGLRRWVKCRSHILWPITKKCYWKNWVLVHTSKVILCACNKEKKRTKASLSCPSVLVPSSSLLLIARVPNCTCKPMPASAESHWRRKVIHET